MKKLLFSVFLILLIAGLTNAYEVGDFGSLGTGNWGTTNANWRQWDGSGWNTIPAGAPTSADNVWILSGHTVIVEASNKPFKNLTVETGATLYTNQATNRYLNAYGNITNNGTVGGATDGLSLNIAANCTISGTGTTNLSRIRNLSGVGGFTLTIDQDLTLHFDGAGAIYFQTGGNDITVVINTGKTLTISSTTGTNTGILTSGYLVTIKVYGTIDIPGTTITAMNIYGSSSYDASLEIYPGGTLKIDGTLIIGSSTNKGTLKVVGSSGNPATITRSTGGEYWTATTYAKSTIDAKYAVFEYMDKDGLNIASGATINTTNKFDYCVFRNGQAGTDVAHAYLLKIAGNNSNFGSGNPMNRVTFVENLANYSYAISYTGTPDIYFKNATNNAGENPNTDGSNVKFTNITYNTITIDGTNDFNSGERFTSTTANGYGYITWDDTYLYVGFSGNSACGWPLTDNDRWLCVYIDTDPKINPTDGTGTTSDVNVRYNNTLPFTANYAYLFETETLNQRKYDYSGGWNQSTPSYSNWKGSGFWEGRIPRSDINNAKEIYIVGYVIEDWDGGSVCVGLPSDAFTDGASARTLTHYYYCNLAAGFTPNAVENHDGTSPPPFVSVNAPNGSENWLVNSSHNILWTATDNVGVVSIDIDYSTNGGTDWISIATGEANDGSYTWTIPNTPSTNCLVRVKAKDTADNVTSDVSDAVFTIHYSQFIEDTFPLTSLRNSSVAFGDYNRDGKVDLVVSGLSSSNNPITKLYKNTGSGYVADYSRDDNLVGVYDGSVAFADIDNDGDLDLVVSGNNGTNGVCNLYKNEGGRGRYVLQQALPGVKNSAVAFGDYNNDGDIDLFVTGVDNTNNKVARLYKNTDGTFTDVTADSLGKPNYFRPVSHGSVKFFNYDNDMDVDLIVTGQGNTNRTILYTNQSGRFFENYAASFVNVAGGDVAYGDYDNDGDFDLVITGVDGSGARHTKLYKNNGDSTLFSLDSNLTGVSGGSVAFGDVDNDGDLDLVLGGSIGYPNYICKLYLNNGSGVFSEDTGVSLPGIVNGSLAFGDYDADGDLDLVVAGKRQFKLYKNNETTPNTRPNHPYGLSAYSKDGTVWFHDTRVVFSWNAPVDDNTPKSSITYNIRVGTTPGGNDVYSAAVGTDFGKYGLREGIWLVIPPGTYYWSVQAVDNGLMKSVWAPEKTVVNNSNPYTDISMRMDVPNAFALSQNYPNPFNPETVISYQLPVGSNVELKIYSITGQLVRTLVSDKQDAGYYNIRWNGKDDNGNEVSSGLYIYTIKAGEFSATKRMVMVK